MPSNPPLFVQLDGPAAGLNGPAFTNITLRDLFAAAALAGLAAQAEHYDPEYVPELAFNLADAMLAQREGAAEADTKGGSDAE